MVGDPSFSQPCLCIQVQSTTTPLQSTSKILSSTSFNFHLPFPPLLFNKIIVTIHTNTPFLYTVALFTSLFLCTTIPAIYTENVFPNSAI